MKRLYHLIIICWVGLCVGFLTGKVVKAYETIDGIEVIEGEVMERLSFLSATELTITGGTMTVAQAVHTVDGAGDAADDLDTISGGFTEQLIFLRPNNAARDITLKHGTGNIVIGTGADYTIPDNGLAILQYDDSNWRLVSAAAEQDLSTTAAPTFAGLSVSGNTALGANVDVSGDTTFGDTTRVTIKGGANQDGIVFASLGTATKGIDFTNCGLSGATDYLFTDGTYYWTASGIINTTTIKLGGQNCILKGSLAAGNIDARITSPSPNAGNLVFEVGARKGFFIGNYTSLGGFTAGSSNGTTTITKTTHGISGLAAGDLVEVVDSSTTTDRGWYRLISSTADVLVVDRALGGTQTDVDVQVYKDVIAFFATDGTNGQHIVGFSHQDKPLVIGGDRAGTGTGTVPAAGLGLGSEDILIGAKLAVSGDTFLNAGTIYVPTANQAVSTSTGVTAAMLTSRIVRIAGDGGAATITATPSIADMVDGQIVIFQGTSDSNTVTFQDESNLGNSDLQLDGGADFTAGLGDTLMIMYDSGDDEWYEISRSNN